MNTKGFIGAGLAAIRGALLAAADRAGLITSLSDTIPRAAARRLRTHLRLLETLLRRLLVLMAASIELPEPKRPHPELVEGPAKAGASLNPSEPSQPNRKPRRAPPFALTRAATFDPEALARLRAEHAGRRYGENDPGIIPLLARYQTLLRHLDKPDALARRMARHLSRLKRLGAPRPLCLPERAPPHLGHEIGLVATALPDAVHEALSGWYDSG